MKRFRVRGPKGGVIAPHATAKLIKQRIGGWVKRFGTVRVQRDPHPPKPKPVPVGLVRARRLLDACREFSGPYVWGGGHGPYLTHLSPRQGLDCSSSVSLALHMAGLYQMPVAQVSGGFEFYGESGKGRYVTIHASADHVWIEFTLPEGWHRFDTSPHGDGSYGPRVRTGPRNDTHFTHRHPPGL